MTALGWATLPHGARPRFDLAQAATPRSLRTMPVHRWFFFPHSYSPALVEAILDHWALARGALILDPFVGAGTTLVVARERGYNATGLDISPLAVLTSRVKTRDYDPDELRAGLDFVVEKARSAETARADVPPRLKRAFSPKELAKLLALRAAIETQRTEIREFLLLALLSVARDLSRAVADGGWFRWVEKPSQAAHVVPAFKRQVATMISDVASTKREARRPSVRVLHGDSRAPMGGRYDAIITSPPYPNRHDYTRIFHIELLLMGVSEPEILRLRHGSLRSHVEARGDGINLPDYALPTILENLLENWPAPSDRRVPRMLRGYFEDLCAILSNVEAFLSSGGVAAFVLGNVRHAGVLIPVDEVFAALGEQAGLRHSETWVIRERGNSAQQMGRFGKEPARESIVFLAKA